MGASVSIVNPRRLDSDSKISSSNIKLSSVTGEAIPSRGSSEMKIRFGNCVVLHNAVVAPIELDCILGVDFLTKNRCRIDFGNKMLHLGEFRIHLFFPHDLNGAFVVSHEDHTIPPQTEVVLQVSNPFYGSGKQLVLESEVDLPDEVSLCPTLCDGQSEFLTIRLRNSSTDSIKLLQGRRMASVGAVSEVIPLECPTLSPSDEGSSLS